MLEHISLRPGRIDAQRTSTVYNVRSLDNNRRFPSFIMTEASPGAKRLRLSLPDQENEALQIVERDTPATSTDLIAYFAERGSRAIKLQRENSGYQDELARLQDLLRTAEQEINGLKVGKNAAARETLHHKKQSKDYQSMSSGCE